MHPVLPPPLDAFFHGVTAHDADRIAACFAADAVVHDERQDRVGRDAIRSWADETARRYRPSVDVLTCEAGAEQVSVTGRVSGTFPGSPIELRYVFILAGGLVQRLEIG